MAKKAAKKAADQDAVKPPGTPMEETGEIICPIPADPAMGDKDPEVMAWYRDNAPEEFVRRYANRIATLQLPEPRAERGPVSDFEDEADEVKKPTVIMQ